MRGDARSRHEALVAAWRVVATAGDKLEAFQQAALVVGAYIDGGEIERADAFDDLIKLAESHRLLTREDLEHLISQAFLGIRALGPEGFKARKANGPDRGAANGKSAEPPPLLVWLDMARWDDAPLPERQWAILNRAPLNQAGLFSGEGGTGKSIIELTKDVAHVAGKDWFGSLPQIGPAFYIGAEDEADELHRRLAAIAKHYSVTFAQLIAGGLHVMSLLGKDATLAAATGKSGKVETTALYKQLYEAAGDIKPKNISIDTLSRAFAGNEIDRVQVYAFATHMQALAMVAGGSVTVLSHPSLSGMATGSGISGSTAWHSAFRFRHYLKSNKSNGDDAPDNDLREIEFKKNQYGPLGEKILLRYERGLFLPVARPSTIEKAATDDRADEVFLALVRRFAAENRTVSAKPSRSYAPTVFAGEDEARLAGLDGKALEAAMRRLFKAKTIRNESHGYPSRPSYHIAVTER